MRRKNLEELSNQRLDLLVIGGGIVGSGIARDASLRGIKVGLIDANDFAFGTSSRSSRLLHGGVRYLAQGRVRLVREASVEKTILHRIAPHLAQPLPFIFPAYRGSGWPLWQLRIGVKIYDLLAGKNLGRSEGFSATEVKELVPGLKPDGLKGAVRYYDGFTNDSRLVTDTLRSAQKAGAILANYLKFERLEQNPNGFVSHVKDQLDSGDFPIQARTVVNATGPWAQGLGNSKVQLRLTKGIHLVFDAKRLSNRDAVVITEGSRVLFVLPWGERTIVGTTDTDYRGAPEQVRTNAGDVEYLLRTVNEFFPNARLTEADVVSSYSGLRPLIADPNGKPSDISRSHSIQQTLPGWWDVAGGKLTTYRLMAEQTVDQISKHLGGSFEKCRTGDLELLPRDATKKISQLTPPEPTRELIDHFCKNEFAMHLDDVMMRRGGWHSYRRDARELAEIVAAWMGEVFGWTDQQKEAELRRYHQMSDWPVKS
jgi:glycerol-3-phosphate dehydrogenase